MITYQIFQLSHLFIFLSILFQNLLPSLHRIAGSLCHLLNRIIMIRSTCSIKREIHPLCRWQIMSIFLEKSIRSACCTLLELEYLNNNTQKIPHQATNVYNDYYYSSQKYDRKNQCVCSVCAPSKSVRWKDRSVIVSGNRTSIASKQPELHSSQQFRADPSGLFQGVAFVVELTSKLFLLETR